MSSSRRVAGIACLAVVFSVGPSALLMGSPRPDLSPALEPLSPFLGNWVGHFDNPGETMDVFATWTEILDGQAVREVRTVPDVGSFESETLYYFDREVGVISYLSVTNNGYVTRGHITYDGSRFVTEGMQVFPDSSVNAKRGTYTFRGDGTLVNEGGHTIVFQRR